MRLFSCRRHLLLGCLALAACKDPAPAVQAPPAQPVVQAPHAAVSGPVVPSAPAMPVVRETARRLAKETLGEVLAAAAVTPEESLGSVNAMRPVLDPRRMRPSDFVTVRTEDGQLALVSVQRAGDNGVPETVRIVPDGKGAFTATRDSPDIEVRTERLSGSVTSTLYETMVALGEQPALINQFVDVFASQVDFYREVQNGDGFKLVVEKRYAGDRFIGYGRVLAAEYKQTWRIMRGFQHAQDNGRSGYFDEKGRSMLTAFLKTPMEFTRITSSFGKRFHPILRRRKAHNGVDYGAPTGTPVWTIGDGKVLTASYDAGCGNHVIVQHGNGITTGYCHLSRYASGIRAGARVSQRQVIGYVGTSGRSTGPHLHFLMKRHGHYVNPQRMEAPRKASLSGDELKRFKDSLPARLADLDAIPAA